MSNQILELSPEEAAIIQARREVEKGNVGKKKEVFGYFRVLVGQHVEANAKGEEVLYSPASGPFPAYSDLVTRFGDDKFQLVSRGPSNLSGPVAQAASEGFNSVVPVTALNTKEDTFDSMTVAELQQHAANEEIDLGKAKTKAEILLVIRQNS